MRKNINKSHRDKSFDSQSRVLNFIFSGSLDMPLEFYDKNGDRDTPLDMHQGLLLFVLNLHDKGLVVLNTTDSRTYLHPIRYELKMSSISSCLGHILLLRARGTAEGSEAYVEQSWLGERK